MNYFFMVIILFLAFSCRSPRDKLYKFDPTILVENKVTLKQIADDIIYIPLDDSIKIRFINQVKMTNKSILVSTDENVLKFNHYGEMIRKIGNKGVGPGEYTYCAKFAVDDVCETVYIKDRGTTIKVYSKDGLYIRDIYLKDQASGIDAIEFYNSGLFLAHYLQFGDSHYNWTIIDTLGTVRERKERTMPEFSSNWLEGSFTYKYDNKLFFWNPYNDTVFSISKDLSYKPSFLFGQGDFRLPKSNFDPSEVITHFMLIRSLFETNRFVVLRYSYNRKGSITLIEKKSKKSFLTFVENFESGGITNDLDGGIDFQPVSYLAENEQEYVIGFFDPYKLKIHVASETFEKSVPTYPEKKRELEKLANSLKETDNPVLVLVRHNK